MSRDTPAIVRSFVAWWADDLPPVSGQLRLIFLTGLLWLALRQFSPLDVASVYAALPPSLVIPVPLFAALGLATPSPEFVRALHVVCLTAWVAAAAGFLTAPALAATAVAALVLHGIGYGVYSAHGWIVPVYTLLFLSLSRCGDDWSVDAVIRRRWPGWPGASRPGSLGASGLPRKLVTLIVVHSLFAAGVAKLVGGWQWADGETLRFYMDATRDAYGSAPRSASLAALLAGAAWPFSLMAVATLALELISPLALLSRRWRHGIVLVALAFHAGVYLLMLPDFSAQAWCYLLLVDWGSLRARGAATVTRVGTASSGRTVAAAAAATAFAGVLLGVIAIGRDAWILTTVPMYSSRVAGGMVGRIPATTYSTREGLVRVAASRARPWATKLILWSRVDVELIGTGRRVVIGKSAPPGPYKWVDVIEALVLQEMWPGTGRRLDSGAILDLLVARAARDGVPVAEYRTVRLVYRAEDGPVVVFEKPLSPAPVRLLRRLPGPAPPWPPR